MSNNGMRRQRRAFRPGDYRRLVPLVLIMLGVAIIVGVTALAAVYGAAVDRQEERLVLIAESHARLVSALGPGGPPLPQTLEEQRLLNEKTAGRTAELQIARREGDRIVFLTPERGSDRPPAGIAFDDPAVQPMAAALSGRSGTMIGRDDDGSRVLAAFLPLPVQGLGLVARIDMAEINARFLRPGLIAGGVSLAVVAGAALLFFYLGEPMVRRMRESEGRFRGLFENMGVGAAVYRPLPGGDYVFKDFNRAGEEISGLSRDRLVGQTLTAGLPGAEAFGFLEAMNRVRRTGEPERLPTRYYQDDRTEGWWDVVVYRLPTGEIVTLFADVSARQRQAEALRQSEARYRTLVEAQPDPICQFLPDTTITFVNHAYAQFYGTEPEQLIGRRWLDFAAPQERPRFLDELASFTPENPQRHELTRSTRADHEVRWYLCHLHGFFDDAGRVLSFQTFGTDITDRKLAEEKLAQQVALLTAITDSAADAIFVSDDEEQVTWMNPAAERIFGWSRGELVGRKLHTAIHDRRPDGQPFPADECILRRVYATGETLVGHEDVFFHKDGSAVPVACSNAPLVINGRMAGAVLIVQDNSERRRAEAALRESEARYRTAGEAIRYGVWVCNRQGGVEFVSQSFLDLIGKSLDEVKPWGWIDRLPLQDQRRTLDAWHECVRTGGNWSWEHRVQGADGAYRTILSLGRPTRDDAGAITSWVGFNLDLTERTQAEEALRESESRFRGTFENAAVGMSNIGMDGAWLRVNQRLCEIVGYSREELLQLNFQDLTHPQDLRYTLDRFDELLRGEIDSYQLEKRYVHKDGHSIWVTLTSTLQRDDTGAPSYCITVIEDISARKRAEIALREGETRMRAILDASQDEILLLSTEGEVLAINKAAHARLARRTGGENLLGTQLAQLLPPDQAEQRLAIVRTVAETAVRRHCERQIRGRWFDFWFYPVVGARGQVSEVAVFAREITQQKKSQADLSKLFQAVQQSPMSVVITDRFGRIEYVNPEFTSVTGYTMAEAVSQNPRILKSGHTPPETYAELWTTISQGGVWRGELLNKKKNGEMYWELASIAPVKDGDEITNYVAVKEDITERKEIEDQLRQSQKMQALGQLTGGIAHDFNNLLAIIIGNLQLLGERPDTDPKCREFIDDALWSARRGGELTRRLLAFARRQPLRPSAIDLNEVVRGMTELLRRTLGVTIRVEEALARDLWPAVADRSELERAVVNLAVNARDAMQGAGTLSIETRNIILDEDYAEQYEEVTPGEYAMIAITDTGSGMPLEVLQRVFEPFFTTKEVGKGSGLGLSMVYGFIKQSGGHISIYSRVDQGTSVKLYLPREAVAPAERMPPPAETPAESFSDKLVLVVEDEPKLRKVAVKMLERLGLRSVQAENAHDALDLLAVTHPDVLFTDIELPGGMSGTDLADAVQDIDPTIKVLFTTGYAREAVLHPRWLQEKVPWLLKPYSHQDLARELKALLVPAVA